jgi:hydrogenase maturation protease
LVIGVGNPILGDDGVGIYIARKLKETIIKNSVDIKELALGGLSLVEEILDYKRVIIVDAITEGGKIGQIHMLDLKDLEKTAHLTSLHGIDFSTALELVKKTNKKSLPKEIIFYGNRVSPPDTFNESLSLPVKKTADRCIKIITRALSTD